MKIFRIAIFCVFAFSDELHAQQSQTFPVGTHGELTYNTQSGLATFSVDGKDILSNAHAVVRWKERMISSQDYTQRTLVVSDFRESERGGKKILVTLTGSDLPEMQQVFYTFKEHAYFLTEVWIKGESVATNYMAPLVSNAVTMPDDSPHRAINVPFDNDTFIRYRTTSFHESATLISSEVTAFFNPINRKGIVVGSVEHENWKSGIQLTGEKNKLSALTTWGGYTALDITRDAIQHGALAGQHIKSPAIFFGLFDDWRLGLEDFAQSNILAEPRYIFNWTQPTPVGWNSWGVMQTALTLEKAKSVSSFFKNSLPKFRMDKTAFIDLDSYWDNMVAGGLEGDFSKLTEFALDCKTKGLKPGIYWAPFVDWGKSSRRVEGSTFNYEETWTKVNGNYHELDGGRAMDPTHPATLARIKYVINKFKSCGFEMIKIDFIGHATIEADHFFDPTVKTGMQAFRKGMEYLTDQLDGKMLVYAAISPSLATARYAHMRRIACDAFSDMGATEYTLNSTTYGWWQSEMYNYVDADHVVFAQQSEGENRARFISAIVNGTVTTGDDFSTFGQWTSRAIKYFQNQEILAVMKNGKAFRPLEEKGDGSAAEIFEKQIDDVRYLAIFNYGGSMKTFNIDLPIVNAGASNVKELLSNRQLAIAHNSIGVDVEAKDAVLLKLTPSSVTSAERFEADTLTIYPNPSNGVATIKGEAVIRSVALADLNGKVLQEYKNINRKQFAVELSQQSSGVYLLIVLQKDNRTSVYRVIKK